MLQAVARPFRPDPRAVQALGQRFKIVPPGDKPAVECPAESRRRLQEGFAALAQTFGRVGQAGGQRIQLLSAFRQVAFELAADPALELLQPDQQGIAVRTENLGGGGRGRRAQVGREVGDGEIGFMADAGNHGKAAGADGARHDFLVERPEILDAAAAAAQDDGIAVARGGQLQGGGDPVGSAFALHRRRVKIDPDMRRPAAQRGQHVAQRGGLQAGDDGQRSRVFGQRALDSGGEQSFGFQLRLEADEALEEIALAGAAYRLDVELELAARLVEGHQHPRLDPVAVLQPPAEQLGAIPPHDAAHLGTGILERKIDMSGRRVGQVRNFTTDPGQRECRFEAIAHQAVEAGDADDRVGGCGRIVFGHAGDCNPCRWGTAGAGSPGCN